MAHTRSEPPSNAPRRLLSRALPVLVAGVVAAAGLAGFFVVRNTVSDQEHRILKERTGEVALILQTSFATISQSLSSLGVAARIGASPTVAFVDEAGAVAKATSTSSAPRTIALFKRTGDRFTVAAATGPALKRGEAISGARAAAAARALTGPTMAATSVFGSAAKRAFGFALGPPAAPGDEVVYLELPLQAGVVTPSPPQSPFHDLNLVLYASGKPDPAQLVLTTDRRTPLPGKIASALVPIGSAQWLLVTSARQPLVGSFAGAVPWLILGAGLVGGAVVGGVVLMLRRRRDYALELVDERTAELQSSLRELRDTQERLVLQQRLAAIGQVAAVVGHELRNPLGVMTNALYLVRSKLSASDDEQVLRHLDTAEREIAASAVIVDSLLGFAREREPEKQLVDFPDLLDETLSVAPPPNGMQLLREGLETLPPVYADRQQLRQVLLNLVTNGYEAMGGNGVLTVSARATADEVEIRVADTGPGMDEETAGRVFEPFFTNKAKGIGLGLAVTKQILDGHGGRIDVESRPGSGATFVLTLPTATVLDEVA